MPTNDFRPRLDHGDALTKSSLLDDDHPLYIRADGSRAFTGYPSGPAWQSYTPTWTSSGTQPALGNGTIWGRFTVIGKTVHGWINMQTQSSSTYGTGSYYWTLPVTAVALPASPANEVIGSVLVQDTGTPTLYTGIVLRVSTTALQLATHNTAGLVGATVPMTWETTDIVWMCFTYEAA